MRKILIIDDDPAILEAIVAALELYDFEPHASSQADQAVKLATDINPEVILLDLLLSGENGCDVAQRLKADKETSSIPIVMFSAHPEARERTAKCGASAFLSKPFEIEDLIDTLSQF